MTTQTRHYEQLIQGVIVPSGYKRPLTVDHTKCGSTNTSDYPALFCGTFNGASGTLDLRTEANGGKVKSSSGYDIGFYSDSGCTSPLKWQIEKYDGSTGQIIAHIRIPTLSASVDTGIYINYGNASITSDISDPTGVWDDNFIMVLHGGDGSTLSLLDSTKYHNDFTNVSSNTAVAGVNGGVDGGGIQFVATHYLATAANLTALTGNQVTMECFLNGTLTDYRVTAGILSKAPVNGKWEFYFDSAAGHLGKPDLRGGGSGSTVNATSEPTASVWNHLMATINNTTGKQYLNGAANGSGTVTALADGAEKLYINGLDASNYHGYSGKGDEFRVSSVERSIDYALSQYNNWTSPTTFWSIGSETSVPSSAIKTVDGLVIASVKQINALALASVKTVDGLA